MLREQSNLSAFQILGVWGPMYHTDASMYGVLKYYLKSKVLIPYPAVCHRDIRNFILESEPGLSISGSDTGGQFVGWCHNYPSRHSTGKQYGCVLDIPNFSLQIHHKK